VERVAARERRRETPAQRLLRETGALTVALTRLAVLSALLTPLLLASFLTVDLPVYRFDRLFDVALLKPSNWLSVGGLTMSLGVPLVILMTRKFGGDEASRAVTASWAVAAFLVFAGLAELAPALEDRDLPACGSPSPSPRAQCSASMSRPPPTTSCAAAAGGGGRR
jgi:hypothetical protein